MRTKRMLRRGLTALAAALAMMTALAAPAFAYTGDSADSTAVLRQSDCRSDREDRNGDNQRRQAESA